MADDKEIEKTEDNPKEDDTTTGTSDTMKPTDDNTPANNTTDADGDNDGDKILETPSYDYGDAVNKIEKFRKVKKIHDAIRYILRTPSVDLSSTKEIIMALKDKAEIYLSNYSLLEDDVVDEVANDIIKEFKELVTQIKQSK